MKFFSFLLFPVLLFSCFGVKSPDVIEKKASDFNSIYDWNLYLTDLDNQDKGNVYIKKELAKSYILQNDWQKAELYLQQAENLLSRRLDPSVKYEIWAYLAQIAYKKANYEKSMNYITSALDVYAEDPMLLKLTRANIYYHQDNNEAFDLYQSLWSSNQDQFNEKDVENFYSILVNHQLWEKAEEVLLAYFNKEGFRPGIGVNLSIVYENMNKIDLSIQSIFMDLLYKRAYGEISNESLIQGINALKDTVDSEYFYILENLVKLTELQVTSISADPSPFGSNS
ncbi:MAG: tetratricopeptide repeat protein, partial [Spirochaetaceae bacterium]|nr:tetratricopeptide repeat protein [Spirochaetaceae bacterium]